MLILGVTSGTRFESERDDQGISYHDSAAVLLRDGEIVAAIEEERLNRIKHTNCFPVRAIQYCLDAAGRRLDQVDAIAINSSAFHADLFAKLAVIDDATNRVPPDGRSRYAALFRRAFGVDVADKLSFCEHHLAHAWSAFAASGFSKSLILSIDGDGDSCSGMVLTADGTRMTKIRELTIPQSLGRLYEALIKVLGFSYFDEYKAMGLAPYGDPARFGPLFARCYRLLPQGDYAIEPLTTWLAHLDAAGLIARARRKGDPFTQEHMDFAAALQRTLETIGMHVLAHYRAQTQSRTLCLAGGVAHNCTFNGRVLYSGLFDSVFVQPAAHDAGGAMGAALWAYHERERRPRTQPLTHLFFGTDVGTDADVERALARWSACVDYRRVPDVARAGAEMLAEGSVIAWVQGRSEFGPRALGNRSILADPRPSDNKLRINQMVKKREAYRPFAPSVLEERASDLFDIPKTQRRFPFMIFVLSVRESMRATLGAITHVDGTARVQTVSRETNPLYWRLIAEFEALTGVPAVLNTSFNNDAEPIVDSVDDAVACFLTTGIDCLLVGDFVVSKQPAGRTLESIARLAPELPPFRTLVRRRQDLGRDETVWSIESTKSAGFGTTARDISEDVYQLLQRADAGADVESLMRASRVPAERRHRVLEELMELWSRRIVWLRPPRHTHVWRQQEPALVASAAQG